MGAYEMARLGFTHGEILRHFYRGAELAPNHGR